MYMRKSYMKKILLVSAALFVSFPAYAVIPQSQEIVFDVVRNGEPFGQHRISFDQQGDETRVQIDIRMQYNLGPVTLFRYTHRNTEIWRGDQIVSMRSQTNDDGDAYAVDANWSGDAVKVSARLDDDTSRSLEAPASIYSTSYWNPVALEATQLLNTQKGRVEDVTVRNVGQEAIMAGGQRIVANRYKVDTVLPLDVLYDSVSKQWVGLDFKVRGSKITYRRANAVNP